MEVLQDARAHFLGAQIIGVVITGREHIGADHDPALDLMAETGAAGVLIGAVQVRAVDAIAVAHAVIAGQVRRGFRRGDDVIGRQGVFRVRQGNVDDLAAGRLEPVDPLLPGLVDLGRHAVNAILFRHTDLEPLHGLAAGGDKVRNLIRQRGRILGIMTGHGLKHHGAVLHRLGEGARMVQRGGKGHHAPARGAAIGALHADCAGKRRRLADRAAGIGPRGTKAEISRHRGRRTTGRTARRQAFIATRCFPRVHHGTGVGGLVGGAHGELVHRGLGHEDGALTPQLGGDGGFIGRLEALEDVRGGGRIDTFHGEQILDRQRHAFQQTALTLGQALISSLGHGLRLVLIKGGEGIQRRLGRLAGLDGFTGEFGGGDFLRLQLGGNVREGEFEKIAHGSHFLAIT